MWKENGVSVGQRLAKAAKNGSVFGDWDVVWWRLTRKIRLILEEMG